VESAVVMIPPVDSERVEEIIVSAHRVLSQPATRGRASANVAEVQPPNVASRRKTRESAAYTKINGGWVMASTEESIASLADLLLETSLRHGAFEAVAPPHNWWDWYAAYMIARQGGSAPDDASAAADRYMADVKNVVVSPA
jgi:hypothetical protein